MTHHITASVEQNSILNSDLSCFDIADKKSWIMDRHTMSSGDITIYFPAVDYRVYPDISVYDSDLARQKYRTRTAQELRCFTYTDAELRELLQAAGFSSPSFFAAFPDYKLPEKILPFDDAVENALMEGAPFADEHDGSCGARLENQRELRSHYRSLAQMGIAWLFAPSFFVTASA